MNNEWFFEKFALIADAPGAVDRMRELVLELATEGRIVSQLSSEGNGQTLLTEIRNNTQATDAEILLDRDLADAVRIPSSWSICALGEVAEIVRGVSFPGNVKTENPRDGYVACLRTASIQAEIDWQDLIYIPQTHVSRSDQWVLPNDIMISMANSYELVGKVAVVRSVPQKATFGAFLAAIRPILLDPYYLLYVLRSPRMQVAFRASSSQTTNIANISLGRMRPIPFPLPPLAEQKRIVAKVDELMGLCDELEVQQQERELRKSVLVRSSLSRFAESPTRENLGYLFHNSYDIPPSELRKSILTLAVQGKLVPQDPTDETAEELISRVTSEKARLVRSKEIKNEPPLDPITEGEVFSIPKNWVWCRAGAITRPISSGSTPEQHVFHPSEGIPYLKVYNIRNQNVDFRYKPQFISISHHREKMKRSTLFPGDVVMNIVGPPLGKVAIIPDSFPEWNCNQAISFFRPIFPDLAPWIYTFLKEGSFLRNIQLIGTAGQDNISVTKCKFIPIAIPPFLEQRRIVAKVNQLMALVDELERQQAASREKASNLLDAIVHEMTSGG
ncbi:MAG: restriction endonuclease subunit S [Planctomycetota bacterium]|jgi:type I restriction enzyme S subunit